MRKLRSIQVLRAVAACAVILSHTYEPDDGAAYGAAGVDLFFVISGFIIANIAQERSPLEFARDRASRIYPLWWIAAVPWLLLVPRGPFDILSTLTLWPVYGGEHFVPVLKVGWTLCLEMLFYAGVVVALATRPVTALGAYGLFFAGALTTSSAILHFAGSPMGLEFLMGVAVARLPRRRVFGLLIPLGFALMALTPPFLGDLEWSLQPQWALWRAFEWGGPAALVVWGAVSLEPLFEHRMFDAPVTLGDASYSIYLFHPLIAYGFDFFWPLRTALAIGVGVAMYWLVERKLMAWRKCGSVFERRFRNPLPG